MDKLEHSLALLIGRAYLENAKLAVMLENKSAEAEELRKKLSSSASPSDIPSE